MSIVRRQLFLWKKKPPPPPPSMPHINLRFHSSRHANEIVSYLYVLFRTISNNFSSILPYRFPPAIYRTRITDLPMNWIKLQIGYLHSLHVTKYAHAHTNADWQYTGHFMHTKYMVILLTNRKMSTNAARINGIYVTRSNMIRIRWNRSARVHPPQPLGYVAFELAFLKFHLNFELI